MNLQASKYMYERLRELGIPAKMTRTDDEYLPKNERIKRVKELYNDNPNTILVANHINSGGGEGAEIVYSLKNDSTLAEMALNNIGEAGQIKRKVYQRRLPENPNKDYYYILRETGNTEPILVEYGFIDSTRDAQKLKNNLNSYVEGVVKAIAKYTGYTYYPPGSSPDMVGTYIVQRGDTLYGIAKKFGVSVEDIKTWNNLSSDTLQIGQTLIVSEDFNDNEGSNTGSYIVQKNDTLYGIANKFNISVDELKKLNNLTGNTIYIGQELKVPKQDSDMEDNDFEIYEVKKGDSLWLIANNYGVTVDDLVKLNNLGNLTLQIGQQLKVPVTGNYEPPENTYVVQSGDTIFMGNNEHIYK